MSSNLAHTHTPRIHIPDDLKEISQAQEKKQKRSHGWRIDPTEIKDREKEPIAEGGFGNVYRARYRNEDVAVKELHCRLDKNEMDEFRRELDIWHKLKHPNILPLLGAWDACDTTYVKPFMVSPWMHNGTLKAYLASNKPSDQEKLRIMCEVASAMAYLHDNSIIHGNISSANVLLDENFQTVISDFALARTKHTSFSFAYTTHDQEPGGALEYMAPEMLDWNNDSRPSGSSNKTDVYAFGILLYEVMINGGAVWVDRDGQPLDGLQIPEQVTNGHRPERKRPDLKLEISDANTNVWSLIQQCWRHAASERTPFQQILSRLNEAAETKHKSGHLWRIDYNSIKDCAAFPYGWGGFGLVYKATYDNRPVAFKLLLCRFGKIEMDEFRRELDIWNQLEHPHILPLLGACDAFETADAKPFIVSPYMPNGTLKAYLARKPSIAEKIRIMSEVASGMAYLHENNIVHGDISSMSILLDVKFHAVISDFGFARTKHIASVDNDVSPDTLQYMAPEILNWENPLGSSKKTDVYAYGILFYEVMINGGAVWVTADGKPLNRAQTALQVISGFRPQRNRSDPKVEIFDDDVWSLVGACLRHEPGKRPSFNRIVTRILELLHQQS